MEWFIPYAQTFTYLAIVIALLITSIGFPLPEDVILLSAGFITGQGLANIYIMIPLTMLAILGGDLIMYGIGYYLGPNLISKKPFAWILNPTRLEKVKNFYNRHGKKTIFIARFAPGLRAWVYLLAGTTSMKVTHFLLMDFLAAIISVPLFVWLGYFFSEQIKQVALYVFKTKKIIILIVLLVVLIILLYRWLKRAK